MHSLRIPSFSLAIARSFCRSVVLSLTFFKKGGSTEEAQSSIGTEVATALIKYLRYGSTTGAVNFPETDLRPPTEDANTVRIVNCHHNVPGVLKQINRVLSEFNIEKQICDSKGNMAYLVADIQMESDQDKLARLNDELNKMPENILTRVLY